MQKIMKFSKESATKSLNAQSITKSNKSQSFTPSFESELQNVGNKEDTSLLISNDVPSLSSPVPKSMKPFQGSNMKVLEYSSGMSSHNIPTVISPSLPLVSQRKSNFSAFEYVLESQLNDFELANTQSRAIINDLITNGISCHKRLLLSLPDAVSRRALIRTPTISPVAQSSSSQTKAHDVVKKLIEFWEIFEQIISDIKTLQQNLQYETNQNQRIKTESEQNLKLLEEKYVQSHHAHEKKLKESEVLQIRSDFEIRQLKSKVEEDTLTISKLSIENKLIAKKLQDQTEYIETIPHLEDQYLRAARSIVNRSNISISQREMRLQKQSDELKEMNYWKVKSQELECELNETKKSLKLYETNIRKQAAQSLLSKNSSKNKNKSISGVGSLVSSSPIRRREALSSKVKIMTSSKTTFTFESDGDGELESYSRPCLNFEQDTNKEIITQKGSPTADIESPGRNKKSQKQLSLALSYSSSSSAHYHQPHHTDETILSNSMKSPKQLIFDLGRQETGTDHNYNYSSNNNSNSNIYPSHRNAYISQTSLDKNILNGNQKKLQRPLSASASATTSGMNSKYMINEDLYLGYKNIVLTKKNTELKEHISDLSTKLAQARANPLYSSTFTIPIVDDSDDKKRNTHRNAVIDRESSKDKKPRPHSAIERKKPNIFILSSKSKNKNQNDIDKVKGRKKMYVGNSYEKSGDNSDDDDDDESNDESDDDESDDNDNSSNRNHNQNDSNMTKDNEEMIAIEQKQKHRREEILKLYEEKIIRNQISLSQHDTRHNIIRRNKSFSKTTEY